MNIQQISKVLSTMVEGQQFLYKDFILTFKEIRVSEKYEEALHFLVDVTLPKKGQSYIIQVFTEEIKRIILNLYQYIGEQFGYVLEVEIDGNELSENDNAYFRPEIMNKILDALNDEFTTIGLNISDEDPKNQSLYFDVDFFWDKPPYEVINDSVIFNIKIELSDLRIGELRSPVNLNLKEINLLAGAINVKLTDGGWFIEKITDIFYHITEPEVKIGTSDIYYDFQIIVSKINNKKVVPNFSQTELESDFFI